MNQTKIRGGTPPRFQVEKLARAGWGSLSGPSFRGTRLVLRDLAEACHPWTGVVLTTAEQIAARVGYSERWTRNKIHELEAMGLIAYGPGGIRNGKPMPSFIRVNKAELSALVNPARYARDKSLEARRKATSDRLRGLPPNQLSRRRRVATPKPAEPPRVVNLYCETCGLPFDECRGLYHPFTSKVD